MDANVAVLTPAAVTVWEERQDKVINGVRSSEVCTSIGVCSHNPLQKLIKESQDRKSISGAVGCKGEPPSSRAGMGELKKVLALVPVSPGLS